MTDKPKPDPIIMADLVALFQHITKIEEDRDKGEQQIVPLTLPIPAEWAFLYIWIDEHLGDREVGLVRSLGAIRPDLPKRNYQRRLTEIFMKIVEADAVEQTKALAQLTHPALHEIPPEPTTVEFKATIDKELYDWLDGAMPGKTLERKIETLIQLAQDMEPEEPFSPTVEPDDDVFPGFVPTVRVDQNIEKEMVEWLEAFHPPGWEHPYTNLGSKITWLIRRAKEESERPHSPLGPKIH